jgi:formylglycine-generating enzyme required for sulfatase activity
MKIKTICFGSMIFLAPLLSFSQSPTPKGFVFIKGGTFSHGDVVTSKQRPLVRLNDFEMLDHPITNAEYKLFIDASGFPAPLHWIDGRIPAGKEEYPVIYVNRYDVDAYLDWLSKIDGRVYSLPTTMQFEYASRGGLVDKKYPWGDDSPSARANYDEQADHHFDRWQDYLKPAKWNKPNAYQLYGMAGNVWHMTVNLLDPAIILYKYRITNVPTLEGSRMGGSWARSAEYLRCGNESELSSGIRHPDVGFRPIRQPAGSDWRLQPRSLAVLSCGQRRVLISWALLSDDDLKTRFNVYRASSRNHDGFCINKEPIAGSTTFLDENLQTGERFHYYVRSVHSDGKEGRRSEWIGITVAAELAPAVVTFKPLYVSGDLTPIFGDLDGDQVMDCVIRLQNGNEEMSQDPGVPVQLEAFTSWGRSLWRRDICHHDHCYGSANNVPFNVWDMDNDGKAEVITRMQIDDYVYLAILDGMTGNVKNKMPWPDMATDSKRSSTRIHLSIAYLDGEHPAIITQTGLYENEVFVAFDAKLNRLWQYNSFAETNGSGAHTIEVADVDGDGKQEVFDGTTCLNHDGTLRWSIYRQHPDKVSIHDFLPDRPGMEVFFLVESNAHAGAYMVDANSGEIIWKINREDDPRWTHGHHGWCADIWSGSPGMESMANRAVIGDPTLIIFSASGKILMEPFPWGYHPVEWDGDPVRELLNDNGHNIGKFDGKQVVTLAGIEPNPIANSSLMMVADIYGDFRDELVVHSPAENGRMAINVLCARDVINKTAVSQRENLDYRLWLGRNMGGGYPAYYDRPKTIPTKH